MPKQFYCVRLKPAPNEKPEIIEKGNKKQLLSNLNSHAKSHQINILKVKKVKKKNDTPRHISVLARPMGMPGLRMKWVLIRCEKWDESAWLAKNAGSQ